MLRQPEADGVSPDRRSSPSSGAATGSNPRWRGSSSAQSAIRFRPRFVLDATEMGDLLPLAQRAVRRPAPRRNRTPANPTPPAHPTAPACRASLIRLCWSMHAAGGRPGQAARLRCHREAPGILAARQLSARSSAGKAGCSTACSATILRCRTTCRPDRSFRGGVCSSAQLRRRRAARRRADQLAAAGLRRRIAARSQARSNSRAFCKRAKQTSQAFLYWLQHDVARDGGGEAIRS